MLSKEEIETCKQELKNYIEFKESVGDNAGWARGLRYYIEKLEKAKKRYYEGYIDRNNEIVEICKICKYRDKYRQLEADLYEANNTINQYKEREQKLIKYLEKDITEENIRIINNSRHNEKHVKDLIELEKELIIDVLNQYRRETLERLKGEKNE